MNCSFEINETLKKNRILKKSIIQKLALWRNILTSGIALHSWIGIKICIKGTDEIFAIYFYYYILFTLLLNSNSHLIPARKHRIQQFTQQRFLERCFKKLWGFFFFFFFLKISNVLIKHYINQQLKSIALKGSLYPISKALTTYKRIDVCSGWIFSLNWSISTIQSLDD